MKNLLIVSAALMMSFSSFAAGEKINVCHNSSEGFVDISVSVKAKSAFLREGDFIGTCDQMDSCTYGINDTQDGCQAAPAATPAGGATSDPADGSEGSGGSAEVEQSGDE